MLTLIDNTDYVRVEDRAEPETETSMNLNTGDRRTRSRSNRYIIYERPCTDTSTLPESPSPVNPDSLTTTGSYPWTCTNMAIVRAYGRPGSVYTETWEKKGVWGAWA